jgi:hypothetical protein
MPARTADRLIHRPLYNSGFSTRSPVPRDPMQRLTITSCARFASLPPHSASLIPVASRHTARYTIWVLYVTLTSFPFPETPMTLRIPSAAKTRPSPHPVARLHLLCHRLLTLPTPSNTHIHILHHSHLHRFLQASRHRARRSVTCHPCTAIACRLNSKRRLKIIHIPLTNRHQIQRARKRLSITSKGHMSSPRVPNRPNRWLAQLSFRQPISTIKGTKCLCSFLLSVSFPLCLVPLAPFLYIARVACGADAPTSRNRISR